MSKKKAYFTLEFQFHQMETALEEARNLHRAHYYTSCISHCYQVAHRGAAGLLFGLGASIHTEREVGIGFEAAFVSSERSPKKFGDAYRRLAKMRHLADFEHDYVGTKEEAEEALGLAEAFHAEALRLQAAITAS